MVGSKIQNGWTVFVLYKGLLDTNRRINSDPNIFHLLDMCHAKL